MIEHYSFLEDNNPPPHFNPLGNITKNHSDNSKRIRHPKGETFAGSKMATSE
jgi:hypothetical protein